MNVFAVGGVAVAALWIAVAVLVLLDPLADKLPYPVELPAARPGRDDQWAAFRVTVPHIRKLALAEHEIELAFHPASLDAPDPTQFRWFPQEKEQVPCDRVQRGRHRAASVRERAARPEQGAHARAAR